MKSINLKLAKATYEDHEYVFFHLWHSWSFEMGFFKVFNKMILSWGRTLEDNLLEQESND
jgi:hypothetical protein